jgi:TRAP-type C4-dicarboxylate transport system permease large subunit
MVVLLEMGLISPPVGINVFVVKGLLPDVPMAEIFKGILPFWVAMGVAIALLIAFPQIALIIPETMIR